MDGSSAGSGSVPDERDVFIAELRQALAAGGLVERAIGMLMERHGLDAEAALAALSRLAAGENQPLRVAASRLIENRRVGHNLRTGGRSDARTNATRLDPPVVPKGFNDPSDLSDRELQVLTLIGRGASNIEIAGALYLGLNTVKTYIRTAYRKIGVTRRSQAVIWCHQFGLAGLATPCNNNHTHDNNNAAVAGAGRDPGRRERLKDHRNHLG